MEIVGVLEIGGTHVTAAQVAFSQQGARVLAERRTPLDSQASATAILDALAAAARGIGAPPGVRWGVATPGPFDYAAGIGRFAGVGKFDALNGVDVRAGLAERLAGPAAARPEFVFLNDAAAFGIGEWLAGAARGAARAVAMTLGTGIGGCFLADGVPVAAGPTVPPEGVLHLLRHKGSDLEDLVSARAIVAAYRAASGHLADVADVAARAGAGDPAAQGVFADAYGVLGTVLAPWLERFGAEVLVVGGSIARSWWLVERFLVPTLTTLPIRPAARPDAALLGAAHHALAAHPGATAVPPNR